ncbi:MAG: flagellar hook-associated protein FlgK [Alphaproteobacteria bacterium]|nr:flagellar hook-associated protein FlgK [Alphaproteobacteria bacterium]
MGITSLSAALSGLRVNQQQLDVIANNVANVATEGYTRKILPQSTQIIEGRSIGVLAGSVLRNVDLRLQSDLWTQVSSVGFFDVQAKYLRSVDQFHGSPSANVSIAAEIGDLRDAFSSLSNSPNDAFLLTEVVDQAVNTARKINDLADYYTRLRNDAQDEAIGAVEAINGLLIQIAELNEQIKFDTVAGRTSAQTQDSRDLAVSQLAEYIDISVFSRGDGVLVVQTRQGVELATESAQELFFNATPLAPNTAYPDSAAGLFVGDPTDPNSIEITDRDLGGRLGSLMELRDEIFPKLTAQLDELAHKMALRFEAQGLRLFTDATGTIPLDTPPDSSTNPPTPVEYVGFASEIQVNDAVLADNSLVQKGTFGGTVLTGSNEVIRRIIEFTFGEIDYQLAINQDVATSVDIRAAATGGTTLQNWLGLQSTNTVESAVNISNYASIADIVTAGGDAVFGPPGTETDTFIIRFDDPDFGTGPHDIEIDLRTVAVSGISATQDLVDHIMADPDFATAMAEFGASVSVGANGELVIESSGDIEILAGGVEPISAQGLAFLGLSENLSEAEDPYFDIRLGNSDSVRITIEPGDTEVELLAKINAIDGVIAQIDADGFLSIRPGGSFTNPDFGGDLSIIGGPFTVNGAALGGTALGRTSLDDGVGIAQALFGTYNITGGVISELSPVVDVAYQSETEVGSGVFVPFRTSLLGPVLGDETEIGTSLTLTDYSQKIINENAQELNLTLSRLEDEQGIASLLEQQFLDQSGVNIDQELANLIVIQNAYAASARVLQAVRESFDELFNVL